MCAIDYADDAFTIYRRKTAKARKAHKCDECAREIQAGETYFYAFGVYDGRGSSYHTCAHCAVATEWLVTNCGGFLHGGVQEDIEDHTSEYPGLKRGLDRFIVGMRRKWRKFSDDELMPLPRQALPITISEAHP